MTKPIGNVAIPSTITFSPEATRGYRATVPRHEPETCAELGGWPDDPSRVIDVRFLPPAARADGGRGASSTHFEPNMEVLNFILVNEWRPAGMSILGYIHSHPGGMRELSRGAPGSNIGDVAAVLNDLSIFAERGWAWPYALMPIVTFDAAGRDTVTGWIVSPGNPEPHPVKVVFEEPHRRSGSQDLAVPRYPIEPLLVRAGLYQSAINRVVGVDAAPEEDRAYMAGAIRRLFRSDIDAVVRELSETGQS